MLGKAKRSLVQTTRRAGHWARQRWRVLCSEYPGLLFDSGLEEKFARGPFPLLHHLDEQTEDICLAIEGLRIYWPRNYDPRGLRWVYREVFANPAVNPHAYEFGDVRMTPGSWVLDAGASEGFFVHYALLRGCSVLAVEPVPCFVRTLQNTFQAEIAEGRVRIVEGAVGQLSGIMSLEMEAPDVFSSYVDAKGSMPVRVYTLDELVEAQEIRNLSFVKMDIEGTELHVLEGACTVLAEQRPNLSIAVYHEATTALIMRDFLRRRAPHYHIRFRGVWLRGSDTPRPYMFLASSGG